MSVERRPTRPVDQLRLLPSIDQLLLVSGDTIELYGRQATTSALREVTAELRNRLIAGDSPDIAEGAILQSAKLALQRNSANGLQRVFNLPGTVLHTNLGRAILPTEAIEAINAVAAGFSNLEFDLTTGERGDRESFVEELVCELTGAEAATVVNNNAAAVLLVLNSLAMNREVPVSRGELVEIGGSFRIPEIMQRANCTLVEVGSTNRTHPKDYRAAINDRTALLMKVHTSNYKIEGFTQEVSTTELATIANELNLPSVMDLGSGCLLDFERFGLPAEPTAAQVLQSGVDIITFSGDKLLGGPQCGLIAGSKALVQSIKSNPLKRALRLDKMTLAGIAEVLKLYQNPDTLAEKLPTLRHLSRGYEAVHAQALRVAPQLKKAIGDEFQVDVVETGSQIGSGSIPTTTVKSAALSIRSARDGEDRTRTLAAAFRDLPVPVIGHAHKRCYLLDVRCLDDEAGFVAQLSSLKL